MKTLLITASIFTSLTAAAAPVEYAVLPFRDVTDTADAPEAARARLPEALRRALAEAMTADGRPALAPSVPAGLAEHYLAGRLSSAALEKVRAATSAARFVMGTLHVVDGRVEVTVRLHSAETGRAGRQVRVQGAVDDVDGLVEGILAKLRGREVEPEPEPAPEVARAPIARPPAVPSPEPAGPPPAVAARAPTYELFADPTPTPTDGANVPARVLFWGGLALTAAGAAAGAVSLLHYERKLEDGTLRSGEDNQRLYDTGRGLGLGADISVGVGLGAMALGTVFWLTGVGEEDGGTAVAIVPTKGGAEAQVGLRF